MNRQEWLLASGAIVGLLSLPLGDTLAKAEFITREGRVLGWAPCRLLRLQGDDYQDGLYWRSIFTLTKADLPGGEVTRVRVNGIDFALPPLWLITPLDELVVTWGVPV